MSWTIIKSQADLDAALTKGGGEQLSRQIERFEANAKARAEQAAASQWKLVAIGVVSTVLSLAVLAVAAHSGLSRTERVYQEASRV